MKWVLAAICFVVAGFFAFIVILVTMGSPDTLRSFGFGPNPGPEAKLFALGVFGGMGIAIGVVGYSLLKVNRLSDWGLFKMLRLARGLERLPESPNELTPTSRKEHFGRVNQSLGRPLLIAQLIFAVAMALFGIMGIVRGGFGCSVWVLAAAGGFLAVLAARGLGSLRSKHSSR